MAVNLNTKLGPLTTKMWIVVVGGLGVGLYIYRKSQASNAASAPAVSDATAGVSDQTPSADSASYYSPASGSSGYYDGSNYTPPVAATPPPSPNPAPVVLGPARSTCATNLHRLNTAIHSLGAQLSQLRARHHALTKQIRATKDAATRNKIHAQDVAVQKQAAAIVAKLPTLEAQYRTWQLRCIAVGVVA